MLQDYHLYHDSMNNKVLLSSNRQKQALFDKYIIAQIPGKYYSACHSSFGLVATLYPTRNISRYLCDNIYILYKLYIIIYILVSLARLCVVYVVKEVASSRGLGQLMGVARKRTRAPTHTTSAAAGRKLPVAK